jgi:hypothetical protein
MKKPTKKSKPVNSKTKPVKAKVERPQKGGYARYDLNWTKLHWAAWGNRLEAVKKLISDGADLNAATTQGQTPLHLAAKKGWQDVVRFLVKEGADVNTKDNVGMTPLHWAAHLGHVEVVQILLSLGADINAKTNGGSTPLHIATPSCHPLLEATRKKAQEKPQEDGYTAALVEASHSLFTATSKMLKANLDAHAVETMVILPLIEQAREVERKVEALIAARRSDR